MKKILLCLCAVSVSQVSLATTYDETEYERQIKAQTPSRPSDNSGGGGGTGTSSINTQGMGDAGVNPTPADGIEPGRGYSSDTEAIAPTTCYNVLSVNRGMQTSQTNFSTAQNTSQIASQFNVATDFGGVYGILGLSGMMSYLDDVSENSYSMSFNYSEKIAQSVNMQYSYNAATILNETGQAIYANGTNPMFRLFCGDKLVTSYIEGAGLILSMQVNFIDSSSKEIFKSAVGASVFGFGSAGAQIQNIATSYHLQGQLVVQAYQLGGHPEQLSKIFQNSSNIFRCDINNTTACQNAAATMLNYASNDFPTQFNTNGGVWSGSLVPTGGYSSFPVSQLILAPTYVTSEVKNQRASLLQEYNYYSYMVDYFTNIDNFFPAVLDATTKSSVQAANSVSKNNVYLLEQAPGYDSAIDCWKFPFRCTTVYPALMSQLKSISFSASNLAYCEDPNLYFDTGAICGSNAAQRAFYTGNFFTDSKTPSPQAGWSGFGTAPKVCYATAHYAANGWHDCAGPQQYSPNTTYQIPDFMPSGPGPM